MIIDAVCHPRKTASFLCLKCLPRACGSGHFADHRQVSFWFGGEIISIFALLALWVYFFPPLSIITG